MNKKTVIIIAVSVILVVLLIMGAIGFGIFKIFGLVNKTKTPITSEKFVSIMKENGLNVTDSKKYQYSKYDHVKESLIASDKNKNFQIEFYVIEDEDKARTLFINNKEKFEREQKGSTSKKNFNVNYKNGQTYKAEAGKKYMHLARIDNTIVYVNADSEYKEQIKDILDKIGY